MTDIFNTFLDIVSKAAIERDKPKNWFRKFKIRKDYLDRTKGFIKDLGNIDILNLETLCEFKKIYKYANMVIEVPESSSWNNFHIDGGDCYCDLRFFRDEESPSFKINSFERDNSTFGGGNGGMMIIDFHDTRDDNDYRFLRTELSRGTNEYNEFIFKILIAYMTYYCEVVFDKVLEENLL